MSERATAVRIHHAIIGALAFAFIAAAIGSQFSDVTFLSSNAFVIVAAAGGGLLGKFLVI